MIAQGSNVSQQKEKLKRFGSFVESMYKIALRENSLGE